MSSHLTEILRPSLPPWLETICQRLSTNDASLTTVDLPRVLDDVSTHEVARCIDENHTVTSITMSFFSIVDDGASTMANALGEKLNIRQLQLRDIRNQRELNMFFHGMVKNHAINEISLRHSCICPRGIESVGVFMSRHPNLQEIRLVDTQLVGHAFSRLCHHLKWSSSLERLYFVSNELLPNEIQGMKPLLSEIETPLRELHICENDIDDSDMFVLTEGLAKNKTVHTLDLRSNKISLLGATAIQGLLVSKLNLSNLCLANNELGNEGVSALSRGLQHSSSSLQVLNVASNGCDSKVAQSIASILRHNKSLVELNISFNEIGDAGVHKIARSLTMNTTLRRLQIRKIGMSWRGAQFLGESMPRFSVSELIMTNNAILDEGGNAILQGLEENVNIEYMLLDERMSETISRKINRLIRLNKAGRRVFRQDDQFNPSLWPSIYSRFSDECDIVHYFVQEKPQVLAAMGKSRPQKTIPGY